MVLCPLLPHFSRSVVPRVSASLALPSSARGPQLGTLPPSGARLEDRYAVLWKMAEHWGVSTAGFPD